MNEMSPSSQPRTPMSRKMSPGVEKAVKVQPDTDARTIRLLPDEPQRISVQDFRQMLMTAVMSGASDITFQSDQQPRPEIHGILYRGMTRPLSPTELNLILVEAYGGSNGPTEINAMNVLDFSYELNLPDGDRQRFRVNATGIYGRDGAGVELTFRALPRRTPDLELVKLGADEVAALAPRDGIVVIAGATGSGKSTTMAALTRYHLEESPRPVKIVDIQAPIEYTFRDVMSSLGGSSSTIGQSEVGRHVRSFAEGVHSALRRKPHIINVGEARDFETIAASLEASLTGHLVYTTTHAGSVAVAIRRLLTIFPGNERESRGYDLVNALRFLMVQHLVPTPDGSGRVPVREYLQFTEAMRERLLTSPMQDWSTIVDQAVQGALAGQDPEMQHASLQSVCSKLYAEGKITRRDALHLGGRYAVEGHG
ncbi:type IV pilus twitching motility protein PilT [Leisingera sp. XS_AS12]|uniref:type IV pilus twitching motility protein PilT n=1 Tax=Leisingera sp. XS_AS12 TaxID=3241294 RepID=UPI0035147EE5